MKTKQEILNSIDTHIVTNGNILATETNEILHDMLEFSGNGMNEIIAKTAELDRRVIILEGDTSGGGLDGFTIFSETPTQDKNQNLLWYSFRGINKHFVNFTFRILILKRVGNIMEFDVPGEVFSKLGKIMEGQEGALQFVVAILNKESERTFPGVVSFLFREKIIRVHLVALDKENEIKTSDSIFTSIALHQPNFIF